MRLRGRTWTKIKAERWPASKADTKLEQPGRKAARLRIVGSGKLAARSRMTVRRGELPRAPGYLTQSRMTWDEWDT